MVDVCWWVVVNIVDIGVDIDGMYELANGVVWRGLYLLKRRHIFYNFL